jgi:serine/threonine protein kinase
MFLPPSLTQVLHRDLKSSNLLCDDAYCVKIADFGMSRLKAAAVEGAEGSVRGGRRQAPIASSRLQNAAM